MLWLWLKGWTVGTGAGLRRARQCGLPSGDVAVLADLTNHDRPALAPEHESQGEMGLYAGWEARGENVSVSVDFILKALEEKANIVLIDSRPARRVQNAGTIPGAVNIPVGEIEKRINALPKNKPVVFTCTTGARSGEAYDMVKLIDASLPVYFLDANVSFSGGGNYTIKAR